MSNKGPDQGNQIQLANATASNPSSSDLAISNYLGVRKCNILKNDAFFATANIPGSISRTPKSIYLGAFDSEEDAARAHDLVTLKLYGASARLNFPLHDYHAAIEKMAHMGVEDLINYIKSASSALARGKYRFCGVYMNPETGKWQARTVEPNGDYNIFGAFDTAEEAAVAFDVESIKQRGFRAITNFNIKGYEMGLIFNTDNMQNQPINNSTMRQRAMHSQAVNAGMIWQQAMELQAINARKMQEKQNDPLGLKLQLEAHDPLRLTLGTGGSSLEKPTACLVGLGDQSNQPERMREYFRSWALQNARRELASAGTDHFKHDQLSPFGSLEETRETPKMFDFFGAKDEGASARNHDKWLKPRGVEFKRGSSSGSKSCRNDSDLKGKGKMVCYK